jgi:hypothetical protein
LLRHRTDSVVVSFVTVIESVLYSGRDTIGSDDVQNGQMDIVDRLLVIGARLHAPAVQ